MTTKAAKQEISIRTDMPVTRQHAWLTHLAKKLRMLDPPDDDLKYLADSLEQISAGSDANEVLGVKRGAGRNNEKDAAHFNNNLAIMWVIGAMTPFDSSDTPMSRRAAVDMASELFGLERDNLERMCPSNESIKKYGPDFDLHRAKASTKKKPD